MRHKSRLQTVIYFCLCSHQPKATPKPIEGEGRMATMWQVDSFWKDNKFDLEVTRLYIDIPCHRSSDSSPHMAFSSFSIPLFKNIQLPEKINKLLCVGLLLSGDIAFHKFHWRKMTATCLQCSRWIETFSMSGFQSGFRLTSIWYLGARRLKWNHWNSLIAFNGFAWKLSSA